MYAAAIFLPLLGAAIAGLFGRAIGDRASQLVTCACVAASAAISILIFKQVALDHHPVQIQLSTWIQSGSFDAAWSLRFDTLTAVMLIVVTVVSTCVHVYSIGYMSEDPSIPRFMSYLSLFTFAMLMLVTADNLVQMFFGWEGVGVCSYLLIGFWYDRPSACAAAIKAFVVNRVGDFGFALGIFGTYLVFDAVGFDAIFGAVPGHAKDTIQFLSMQLPTMDVLCVLLFIGAMGKSAQLGLHTWLPDAMEGPTPVSALIHAATMVTAGVFMVCRLSPMFEYADTARDLVTFIGAATAFFAATVGLVQNDIKRVIAYSTCSQLGYMFFAAGVSAYPVAIFHLMTHAFFKALLFLGAGSVIHGVGGEQDMRRMGGLRRLIPQTYILMWIGSLALAGIPIFAGYYSKDAILESAWGAHTPIGQFAYALGILAAVMTAFYSWRLLFMTFHGTSRAGAHVDDHAAADAHNAGHEPADEHGAAAAHGHGHGGHGHHVHESPPVMLAPLYVLALGAVFAGIVANATFVGHHWQEFWGKSIVILESHKAIEDAHHVPWLVAFLPIVAGVVGIATAWLFYLRSPWLPGSLASQLEGLYRFLLNKWYFDEIYDALIVKPARFLGWGLWKGGDGLLIDGLGPNGLAAVSRGIARRASRLQSGYVYHYAFVMLIGVVALVTWYFTRGRS